MNSIGILQMGTNSFLLYEIKEADKYCNQRIADLTPESFNIPDRKIECRIVMVEIGKVKLEPKEYETAHSVACYYNNRIFSTQSNRVNFFQRQ